MIKEINDLNDGHNHSKDAENEGTITQENNEKKKESHAEKKKQSEIVADTEEEVGTSSV